MRVAGRVRRQHRRRCKNGKTFKHEGGDDSTQRKSGKRDGWWRVTWSVKASATSSLYSLSEMNCELPPHRIGWYLEQGARAKEALRGEM
jgi:hypothetical protein